MSIPVHTTRISWAVQRWQPPTRNGVLRRRPLARDLHTQCNINNKGRKVLPYGFEWTWGFAARINRSIKFPALDITTLPKEVFL